MVVYSIEQLLIGSPEQIAVMLQHHTPLQSPDLEHHFSYTACSPINLYDAASASAAYASTRAAVRQYFPIGALQLSRCFASAKYRINGEASSIATFLLTLYLDTIFHFNTTSPHRFARKRVSIKTHPFKTVQNQEDIPMTQATKLDALLKEVSLLLNVEAVDPDSTLVELGVDSMNVVELIMICEQFLPERSRSRLDGIRRGHHPGKWTAV